MRLFMLFHSGVFRFELSLHPKKLLEKNSMRNDFFANFCTFMAIFHDKGMKIEKYRGINKDAPFHALSFTCDQI